MRTFIITATLIVLTASNAFARETPLTTAALERARAVGTAGTATQTQPAPTPVRRRSGTRTTLWAAAVASGLAMLGTKETCNGLRVNDTCFGETQSRTALWTTGAALTTLGTIGLFRWSHTDDNATR